MSERSSLPQRPAEDLRVLGNSVWGPAGEPVGLALSTVKDFGGDLYSGEHPRSSSVTDRIGLLFCKDPGGCHGEEDGWDEGPQEQRGGQLGAPSAKLSADCLSNPAAPRLITAVSSAHKGADLGILQETLGTLQQPPVSHCLLAFPLPSLSLSAAVPTHQTTRWFSPPSCWPWPLFPHTASLQYVVIQPPISVLVRSFPDIQVQGPPIGTSLKKEFSIGPEFSSKSGVPSLLQSPQSLGPT